jgi:hypothetical protein
MATGFYLARGKMTIDKDPDDQLYYGIDMADELRLSGTTLSGVEELVAGVEVLEPATLQGTAGVIKLGGLDVSARPVNYCTLRFSMANGERMDKTIYFKRKDK